MTHTTAANAKGEVLDRIELAHKNAQTMTNGLWAAIEVATRARKTHEIGKIAESFFEKPSDTELANAMANLAAWALAPAQSTYFKELPPEQQSGLKETLKLMRDYSDPNEAV